MACCMVHVLRMPSRKRPPLRLLFVDTETTGFVPRTHRVIEVACVVTIDGQEHATYETLIRPPESAAIPLPIQVLTRIRPGDLTHAPTFETVLPTLQNLVTPDTIVVGQNIPFDIGMLRGEGWDLSQQPWIDTSMLASIVFPELESYSLGFVSTALGLPHAPRHRAMGDVRATIGLLERCMQRLQELPEEDVEKLRALARRGPIGYRHVIASLPKSHAPTRPLWLLPPARSATVATPRTITPPPTGVVRLCQEPLDPEGAASLLNGGLANGWYAVKNLHNALRRSTLPTGVTVFDAPGSLLSGPRATTLMSQTSLTADELTLAMKLVLYSPRSDRDLPLHGGERSVWSGKLACTDASEEYRALVAAAAVGPAILSHRHVLSLAQSADAVIPPDRSLVIEDASMLEDTATQAFGWTCHLPTIRSAAEGDARLTGCVDMIDLWSERVRAGTDQVTLGEAHLHDRPAQELSQSLRSFLAEGLPPILAQAAEDLLRILDPANLAGRFAWIESYGDRQKTISSVPARVDQLLADRLFLRTRTTLLGPPGDDAWWSSILRDPPLRSTELPAQPSPIRIVLTRGMPTEQAVFEGGGRTIALLASKRLIEDLYVRHAEAMEAKGGTLLCQGLSGGMGRMQAEFAAATPPAILAMTPWMYEGLHLPPASVRRLVLPTLPFDHPSHPVISRRGARFQDSFNEYALPRLLFRLARIVRHFARHATHDAELIVLDDRLATKAYGARVAAYMSSLSRP